MQGTNMKGGGGKPGKGFSQATYELQQYAYVTSSGIVEVPFAVYCTVKVGEGNLAF